MFDRVPRGGRPLALRPPCRTMPYSGDAPGRCLFCLCAARGQPPCLLTGNRRLIAASRADASPERW
jgi:hypothetical protein